MPRDAWNGASFTGQNRVRAPHSSLVCAPCVWFTSRLSPVPGRPPKEGKQFGGNYRNYSHVFDERGYQNFSKGEKPALLAWLRGPKRGPWFAAIADSGQKHVLPWTPINPTDTRRGIVLFEEAIVTLPVGDAGWTLVDRSAALLTEGATKEEIATGHYGARAWQLCGEALVSFEDERGRPKRGSTWFELALWLAQRDEEQVQARLQEERNGKAQRRAARALRQVDGGAADGGPARVPRRRRKPSPALGPDHGQDAGGGTDDGERAGVDDGAAAVAPTRRPVQRSLFGD
jgi:hypothetical protein